MTIPQPPKIHELPAGTVLRAGLGTSAVIADFDFETYSPAGFVWDEEKNKWGKLPNAKEKGLGVVGAAVYTEHPDAEVLSLAYNLKDGQGCQLWVPGGNSMSALGEIMAVSCPSDLFEYLASGGLIEAWNVGFERWVWNNICAPKYGFPPLPEAQLRCAMAKARAFSLPGRLGNAADVLQLTNRKDKNGERLIKKFTMPRDPTVGNPLLRNYLSTVPGDTQAFHRMVTEDEDTTAFYRYNMQDIIAEAEASSRIPDLSPTELEYWQYDQKINSRGVYVDHDLIKACTSIVEQAFTRYTEELAELTGGIKSTEVAQLKKWMEARDVWTHSLDKESVANLLKQTDLHAEVRRALEIRQLLGSGSVKKLYAMANQRASDGRLHDLFVYYGARTGRATGAGPQPQNLPKGAPDVAVCLNEHCGMQCGASNIHCPWCGINFYHDMRKELEWSSYAVEDALEIIKHGNLDLLEYYFDNALTTIKGCLRGLFIPAPGHDYISSDFSAIEAIVSAEEAGEEWRLEVFRTHGKIYEMSASKITGIPFEEILNYVAIHKKHHPARAQGKVAELASGFGGWIKSWQNFGADEFFNEAQIKEAVIAWRNASPAIVEMWGGQRRRWKEEYYGLEGMAVLAILYPGTVYTYRTATFVVKDDVLYSRLPSGRYLVYHKPRLHMSDRPYHVGEYVITYEGWNSGETGTPGWSHIETYGPKLFENRVQAIARDILMHGIVNLEKAGYPVVLHVHDEVVSEVPENFGSIEEFERILSTMPAWALHYPVKVAGGWRGKRYRKG